MLYVFDFNLHRRIPYSAAFKQFVKVPMKKMILILSVMLSAAAQAAPMYSLTCIKKKKKEHTLDIYDGYVYLDGDIYLYKDDQSALPVKSRATHSLFNDDDLDLVIPNSYLSGDFTHDDVVLVDFQSLENYPLKCSVKNQSNP